MPESTLNLSLAELNSEVASFLGWGRDSTKWDARKKQDIEACMASCLRKFYFQSQPDPRDSNHNWSFMKPVATFPILEGSATAPLPDDFGGFEGMVTMTRNGQSGGYWPLKLVSEEMIRVRYAATNVDLSGRPIVAAERQIKGTGLTKSNRAEMYVFPVPDQDYNLSVPYYILPNFLTTANPYPYGGAAHAETMKAGARAAAELFLDGTQGPENANYMQCLAASIQYDRRHQPKSLGMNSDMSDYRANGSNRWPQGLWHPLGIGFLDEASYS